MKTRSILSTTLALALVATTANAEVAAALKKGKAQLKSVGALAFAPDGLLYAADAKGAAIFALQDADAKKADGALDVKGIDAKIAAVLGTKADDIKINDLAVSPTNANAYVSVSRGRGPDATPVIVRVAPGGKITTLSLGDIPHAKAELSDAPEDKESGEGRRRSNKRMESITDMAIVDGKLAVAGLSNEEFASTLRMIDLPFSGKIASASVEIYHAAHGKLETHSPIRTFLSMDIEGEQNLVASYTCTPLVTVPVKKLTPKAHVKGVTVAELGNRNRPLDMIEYKKDGKRFILMANSARGIMKVDTKDIGKIESLSERASEPTGLSYETIDKWEGIVQLDRLDDKNALVILKDDNGHHLQKVELP